MTPSKTENKETAQEKIESIASRAMHKIKELSKQQRVLIETFLENVRKRRIEEIRKEINEL